MVQDPAEIYCPGSGAGASISAVANQGTLIALEQSIARDEKCERAVSVPAPAQECTSTTKGPDKKGALPLCAMTASNATGGRTQTRSQYRAK